VLDQTARLPEALRTDELRDALARRAQLRDQHQSSYRVHTQLWHSANCDTNRDRGQGREL
jgi:hypothetical protein